MPDNKRNFRLGGDITRRSFMSNAGMAAGALGLSAAMPRMAGAQQSLIWYTGSQVEAVNDWVELFREQTGITCDYYRAGGLNIAQKFEQEVRAGQVACSLVSNALVGLIQQWADQGLLMEYDSPEYAHYPDDICIGRYAAPIKLDVVGMAYNSEMISAEEAPKSWEDVLDPKWKGKMVMADAGSSAGALHWFAAIQKEFGNEFMEKLAEQDVLIRTGNGEVVNTLISGERPLSCMVYQYHTETAIERGAGLRVLIPEEGAPVGVSYLAIAADAPDPEGAKKFMDFALGYDAQHLWTRDYFTGTARVDVPPLELDTGGVPLSQMPRIGSTPADMVEFFERNAELTDEWVDLFKS